MILASPEEQVAQRDEGDDLLADLDRRPALNPEDLAGRTSTISSM